MNVTTTVTKDADTWTYSYTIPFKLDDNTRPQSLTIDGLSPIDDYGGTVSFTPAFSDLWTIKFDDLGNDNEPITLWFTSQFEPTTGIATLGTSRGASEVHHSEEQWDIVRPIPEPSMLPLVMAWMLIASRSRRFFL